MEWKVEVNGWGGKKVIDGVREIKDGGSWRGSGMGVGVKGRSAGE